YVAKKAGTGTCMVQIMRSYLSWQGAGDNQEDARLFRTADNEPMSADTPRGRLRYWMDKAKFSAEERKAFSFHSLRAGGATDAVRQGVPVGAVKLHGNWASDAVLKYV